MLLEKWEWYKEIEAKSLNKNQNSSFKNPITRHIASNNKWAKKNQNPASACCSTGKDVIKSKIDEFSKKENSLTIILLMR